MGCSTLACEWLPSGVPWNEITWLGFIFTFFLQNTSIIFYPICQETRDVVVQEPGLAWHPGHRHGTGDLKDFIVLFCDSDWLSHVQSIQLKLMVPVVLICTENHSIAAWIWLSLPKKFRNGAACMVADITTTSSRKMKLVRGQTLTLKYVDMRLVFVIQPLLPRFMLYVF